MWNLLNGEFYKLRKSKLFYVCMILMVVAVFWLFAMVMIAQKIEQGEIENGQFGVVVSMEQTEEESLEPEEEPIGIWDMYQVVANNLATMVTVIFASIFVIGEFGNGAVKNFVGKGKKRYVIFLAKYMTVETVTILLSVIGAVTSLLAGGILFGTGEINGEFLRNYVIYALFQTVLLMALAGVVAAASEMIRTMGAGVVTAVCIAGGVSGLFFYGMDLVLRLVRFPIKLSDYWLTELMQACPMIGFDAAFVRRLVIGVVFWTAAAVGVGAVHFSKADIK